MSVFGQDAYPSFASKAAVLLRGIVRNDALVEGNEAPGPVGDAGVLLTNDRDLAYTVDEAEAMVLAAATGSST